MANRKKLAGTRLEREIRLDRRQVDEQARTVEVAFSSETPVERFFGMEILDHAPSAARLDRLNGGAAVLMDHNSRDQVGVVEQARIDPDRRGRALLRFGRNGRAAEVFGDVVDGIRNLVSVGYLIHREEVEHGEGNAPDTVRITDWEPLEISIVAVPADASVGVGRHRDDQNEGRGGDAAVVEGPEPAQRAEPGKTFNSDRGVETMSKENLATSEVDETRATDDGRAQGSPTAPEAGSTAKPEDRTQLDDQIRDIGRRFGLEKLADDHIELRASLEQFREASLAALAARASVPHPHANDGPRIEIPGRHTAKRETIERFAPGDYRQAQENAYKSGMWVRARIFGDERAERWCRDKLGTRVMAGGINSKGGAIVPDEMSAAIIDLREQYGVARRLCRVFPMGSDTLTIPRRTGGVTASWTGENVALTASDKSWDDVTLVAKKLTALTRMSTEYAEDAVIDVAADLAGEMSWAFAEAEDDAWLNGDGTSTYGGIHGVRVKMIDGNHAAGAVDAASGIDTYAEVTAAELEGTKAVVPAYAQQGAVWLASQPAKVLVFDSLSAAAGGNTITDIGNGPVMAYQGNEIVLSQKMSTSTGDLSNVVMLLFGRFDLACALGDRRGFRVQVLNELYAASDQIGIMATERVDIVAHDLGDGTNAGPVAAVVGE